MSNPIIEDIIKVMDRIQAVTQRNIKSIGCENCVVEIAHLPGVMLPEAIKFEYCPVHREIE